MDVGVGKGCYAASQTTYMSLYMKRFNKTESPIFVLLCVLCIQRQPSRFLFYFTTSGVKCPVTAVKHRPVLHHNADCIFISFGIIEPFWLL